jgi:hypothetical protein
MKGMQWNVGFWSQLSIFFKKEESYGELRSSLSVVGASGCILTKQQSEIYIRKVALFWNFFHIWFTKVNEAEVRLNNIYKFSSYLKANILFQYTKSSG